MQTIEQLYHFFYEPNKQISLQNKIEERDKILSSTLLEDDIKSVLRIIETKDLISGIDKQEHFIGAFKLTQELLEKLKPHKQSNCISGITETQLFFIWT